MPLRLTLQEWAIVMNQCYRCRYWDIEDGCLRNNALHELFQRNRIYRLPIDNCSEYDA